MLRPLDSILIDTTTNFTTHDPIIPYGVFAVNSDGSGFKLGDGVNVWSALSYQGSSAIRNKQVQSSREPANNELLIFCEATDKWIYRLQHCFDTVTNWESSTSVFPTSTLLVETADLTGIPTGRFKIGDGATAFPTLPWFGADFNTTLWSAGESIEYNGSSFEPATYLKPTDLQSAASPIGKFHKDDGTWAYLTDLTNLESINASYGVFPTVYIGGFPTEATTVTLTSDGTSLFIDDQKVWTEYNDGTGSGLDADTLDGRHYTDFATGPSSVTSGNLVTFGSSPNILLDSGLTTSGFATINHTQPATTVTLLTKSGSIYDDVQDWANIVQSSGRISGGVITAHSPADGTVDISALTGFIKYADSDIAETRYFDMVASTSVALTDNQTNYIYVEYNAGTPRIQVTTNRSTIRYTDQFTLGRAFRSGTGVEILMSGINLYNRTRKIHEKWIDTFGGLSYASGILTSATGLKPAITAGVMYAGSNRIDIDAKDCNGPTDRFTAYYYNPTTAAWVTVTGQDSLSATQYNNTSTGTGLVNLSANRYAVHWLYVCPDGDIYALYGQSDYTLANAQAAAAPALVPNYLSQWCKLAAKVIIARNATNVDRITYAWATQFPVQQVGAHNDLAGLQGGTTDQYYHLTSAQSTALGTWAGALASDPSTPVDGTMYWNTGSNVLKVYVNASVGWKTFTVT